MDATKIGLFIASVIGALVNVTPDNVGTIYISMAISLLGPLYGAIICIIMLLLLGRLYKVKCEKMEKN